MAERFAECRRIVDVRRPVQGHDAEPIRVVDEAFRHAFARQGFPGSDRVLAVPQQRVDHHVADKANAFRRYPFAGKVRRRAGFGRIEHVRNLIGENAIDLFRHAAVEASQPGFDMNDGHQSLAGNQAARQG